MVFCKTFSMLLNYCINMYDFYIIALNVLLSLFLLSSAVCFDSSYVSDVSMN